MDGVSLELTLAYLDNIGFNRCACALRDRKRTLGVGDAPSVGSQETGPNLTDLGKDRVQRMCSLVGATHAHLHLF